MTDLPPGKWSAYLVGAWWPAPPTEPVNGVQHWSDHSTAKEREAVELQAYTNGLGARNSGQTTEDELTRLRLGYHRLTNAAEHCRSKSAASGSVANAVTDLRRDLTKIAEEYNPKIDALVAKNTPTDLDAAIALVASANTEATDKAGDAVEKIVEATKIMFTDMGIGDTDARKWLEEHGAKTSPSTSRLPTREELSRKAADTAAPRVAASPSDSDGVVKKPSGSTGIANLPRPTSGPNPPKTGDNNASNHAPTSEHIPCPSAASTTPIQPRSNETPNPSPPNPSSGGRRDPLPAPAPANTPPINAPTPSPATPTSPTPVPASPGLSNSGASSLGGAMSPSTASAGGMPPGLQAAAPAQALASPPPPPSGAHDFGGSPPPLLGTAKSDGLAPAPAVAPSPPVTPMAGGALTNMAHAAGTSAETAPAAPAAAVSPSPPLSAAPAAFSSAPVNPSASAPSGPLPGYGADLRPAASAVSAAPAMPASSASPSSLPPSVPTTPSAGAALTTAAERSGAGTLAAGGSGSAGASAAGGLSAGATSGAAAGTAARRLAEYQDLQRKVSAVARQAPQLTWAVGLRDDGVTTVLATDLADGWIPPAVKLPAGLSLLDPARRRPGTNAVDLLGAVVVAASHQPNGYITPAEPDEPIPGGGERARYGQRVDELGPTLVGATGMIPHLPRFVQTVARAATRRSGIADNEIELFVQLVDATQRRVLSTYPRHAREDVADWMLLAAIDSLIDGSDELAQYHLAWYRAVTGQPGGAAP